MTGITDENYTSVRLWMLASDHKIEGQEDSTFRLSTEQAALAQFIPQV